jgi:RNA polymerase primary sigma factor
MAGKISLLYNQNQRRVAFQSRSNLSLFTKLHSNLNHEDADFFQKIYADDGKKFKKLNIKVQAELAMVAKKGDINARDMLINSNRGLVISIALKHVNMGVPLSDLIQLGEQGFVPAIRTFDPAKGNFPSHVSWWIRQPMTEAIRKQSKAVHVPLSRMTVVRKVQKGIDRFQQKHKREPTFNDIANMAGISIERAEEALQLSNKTLSLDAPAENTKNQYHDTGNNLVSDSIKDPRCAPPDEEALSGIMGGEILREVNRLDDDERKVIQYTFGMQGLPRLTSKEIGTIMKKSRDQVGYVRLNAFKKLQLRLRKYRGDV